MPSPPVEPPAVVPVVLPALVTSGPDGFWQEGTLAEMPGGNANVTVNENTAYQTWLGFGGTFNEAGWDALSVIDAAERDRAVHLLFDAADGANFQWGRIPMGASDYAMDRYSLAEQADDFTMSSFSIERDRMRLIPFIKAALAVKPDVRLWASPWSPPAWMKDEDTSLSNGNPMNGGRIRQDRQAEVLSAYSLYFVRFIQEYGAEGLKIESVYPQNEPGYDTRYPSCLWTPELYTQFVRDYLGPTLSEQTPDVEIWLGTMSNADVAPGIVTAVMGDAMARSYIKGIGLQWGMGDNQRPSQYTSSYNLPIMQTEHKCGNYHWLDTFNPDKPPNDYAYAVESWDLIKQWLEQGVSVYSAWNMVLDTVGKNLDWQRPWPQNALLTVDRSTKKLIATPAYYVFRHISQFVQPGATRVQVQGQGANALAFKNPDGGVVAIVHNADANAAQSITLSAAGKVVQFSVPRQGWATVNLD